MDLMFDNDLIVFGGRDGKRNQVKSVLESSEAPVYHNDVFVLDLTNMTWSLVECLGSPPKPRAGHSCAVIDSKMFVFGGSGFSPEHEKA